MAVDGRLNFDTKIDTKGFNAGTKQLSSGLGGLKSMLGKVAVAAAAAFSVKAISQFAKESSKMYQEQMMQEVKLQTIMRQRMGATDSTIKSIKDYASELQKTGVIGDEVQLAGAQQVATYLNQADSLKKLMPAMNNLLAQQKGLNATTSDAANIGNLFGKVMQGQTSALKRCGITFTSAEEEVLKYGNETERAAMLAQVVTNNVGNMNAELAKTNAGKQKQLANTYGDLKEQLGQSVDTLKQLLLPSLSRLVNAFATVVKYAQMAANAIADVFGIDLSSDSGGTGALAADTAEIADNYDSMAESAEQAQKAQENQLAGFDKITKLSDDKASGTAESASSPTSMGLYGKQGNISTKVDVDTSEAGKKVKDFFKKVKTWLDDIRDKIKSWVEDNFGIDIIGFAGNLLLTLYSIKDICLGTIDSFIGVLTSFGGLVGTIFTGVMQTIFKTLHTLAEGIRKFFDKNKEKIIKSINTINNNLQKSFQNLGAFFRTVFDALCGSIDRMRSTVSTAISNLLTGISTLFFSIFTILSDALRILSENFAQWATSNKKKLGEVFDSIQQLGADVMNLLGEILSDIGETLTNWWESDGASIWDNICEAVLGVADVIIQLWEEWIYPVLSDAIDWIKGFWNEHLKPLVDKILSVFGKIADCIATVWNKFLKPVVSWVVDVLGPLVTGVFSSIGDVFSDAFGAIADACGGIFDALGGVMDFITGVFTGNWKKAWGGIKDIFKGIWDGIWGIFKGIVNLIIDAVNLLWKGIYWVVSSIVNAVGSVAGVIGDLFGWDWEFSMPDEPPLIPRLATGTVVPANYGEFLAILGDNKKEREYVSPESAMKQSFKDAIREMGGVGGNGGVYEFTINLDGRRLHKEIVRINNSEIRKTSNNPLVPTY